MLFAIDRKQVLDLVSKMTDFLVISWVLSAGTCVYLDRNIMRCPSVLDCFCLYCSMNGIQTCFPFYFFQILANHYITNLGWTKRKKKVYTIHWITSCMVSPLCPVSLFYTFNFFQNIIFRSLGCCFLICNGYWTKVELINDILFSSTLTTYINKHSYFLILDSYSPHLGSAPSKCCS